MREALMDAVRDGAVVVERGKDVADRREDVVRAAKVSC